MRRGRSSGLAVRFGSSGSLSSGNSRPNNEEVPSLPCENARCRSKSRTVFSSWSHETRSQRGVKARAEDATVGTSTRVPSVADCQYVVKAAPWRPHALARADEPATSDVLAPGAAMAASEYEPAATAAQEFRPTGQHGGQR